MPAPDRPGQQFPSPPPGDPDALAGVARAFATTAAAIQHQQSVLLAELRTSDSYVRGPRAGRIRRDLTAAGVDLAALMASLEEASVLLAASAAELRERQARVAALEREARQVSAIIPAPPEARERLRRLAAAAEQIGVDQQARSLRAAARLRQVAAAGLPPGASSAAAVRALARARGAGTPPVPAPRGLALLRALLTDPLPGPERPTRLTRGRPQAIGARLDLSPLVRSLRAGSGPSTRPVSLVAAVLGGAGAPRRGALFRALRLAASAHRTARLAGPRPVPAGPVTAPVTLPARLLAEAVETGDE